MDDREQGVTYIELTISMLIASIAVMALVTALRTAFRGNLMAKDKTRAMTLARDRLEEVKNSGYSSLTNRYSNYVYPDNGDPAAPLYQKENVVPYPAVKPSVAEDPWTPETILIGNTTYWRHVVVKFVTENASGKLEQDPLPCPSCVPAEAGGSASSSNLAMIEVDVTWWSRRLSRMQQVRVSTLVANANIPTTTIGEISGTVLDDDTDDNGDNPTNAIVLLPTIGPDDAAIKSQQIIVVARQLETNDTYSTKTSTVDGTYTLSSLPYGGYYVEIRGAPGYRDSAYTGYDEPPGVSSPIKTVTLSPAAIREKNISIFTTKLKRITLHVKIKGVDATVTPQAIRATVDDGVSADYLQTLSGANYDASNPWVFVISNVAVPYTGAVNYTLKVENQTSLTNATARFCVASSVTGGDLYVGWGATVPGGALNSTCPGSCTPLSTDCTTPMNASGPLDVAGTGIATSSLHVKIREYYNNSTNNLTYPANTWVKLTGVTTGITYTCTPTASGDLIFSPAFNTGVPAEPAGNLKLDVWVGTTGYTTDSLTSTFDVIPGGSYDLEESGGWAVEPSSDKRRNLVVSKASRLCGTVYDGTGAPMAQAAVRIRCPNTEWSSIVTTNAAGLFVHSAVPVETYSYYVEPLGGADYVSTPVNRLVTVSAAGLTYNKDQTAADMKFNMVAVNAEIKGQVYHPAGTKASTGVLVIATTYAGGGAFPTKLPATSLANTFSYSTITMTDGAYSLKVASGIGQYYLYAYLVDNGVAKLLATPAGPVTVNSAAPVVQDLVVP